MRRKLEHLSDAVLRCRGGYNHAWDDCAQPIDLNYRSSVLNGWRIWLRCTRCGAVRLDHVDKRTGDLIARRYWLPEGYEAPKGLRRVAFRQELGVRRGR